MRREESCGIRRRRLGGTPPALTNFTAIWVSAITINRHSSSIASAIRLLKARREASSRRAASSCDSFANPTKQLSRCLLGIAGTVRGLPEIPCLHFDRVDVEIGNGDIARFQALWR
jgi:hypothetical protein